MNARRTRAGTLAALLAIGVPSGVAPAPAADGPAFDAWLAGFRPRVLARGVSAATFDRVAAGLAPDPRVLDEVRNQPEFREELWQYLNRRVSEWRLVTGKEKAGEHAELLARIERDYGVPPAVLLGLWGIESAYGDPIVQKNHARPVVPALATLAWREPRRRDYWARELVNTFVIVERGWAAPHDLRGSWAGAMGHTQWMPDTWLTLGIDYDGDGRVSPFGSPADALGSSARFLVRRGHYRRGEPWGTEVRLPTGMRERDGSQSYRAWAKAGISRADGTPFPRPDATARLWIPVAGGPAFLLEPNFYAVRSYNPSSNYTLAVLHLGDRVLGGAPFVQAFPGSERPPTLAELQEIQRRLTALGYDTGGVDGRVGNQTRLAARRFQQHIGVTPADGYAGVTLLAKLRAAEQPAAPQRRGPLGDGREAAT
ncbi:MAG: lytic murein transglycosylase [Deltaproteobacteria bacterium]|nr:lytic murein transglycosylase [Deltaproteobacteria bacterium]